LWAEVENDRAKVGGSKTLAEFHVRVTSLYELLAGVQIANSLTEQCGHKTFQISGFWADYGQP